MKMQQTVAGVRLVRSLGFQVGEIDGSDIMVEKFARGLLRWRVRRYQRSEVLGRGVTLTEALKQAKANLVPRRFIVGGAAQEYSLQDMIATNQDDQELCDWLMVALPGDRFPNGEGCECVAGLA